LKLREDVTDVALDRLFGEKQPLADVSIDETVRDELEYLDLSRRR
jgi:hypothetical protein